MQKFLPERPSQYQAIALLSLARLSNGDPHPEVLHTLRTTLRRLQASFQLEGRELHAASVGRCASRFSTLRTLHVFNAYLTRREASKSDLALIHRAVQDAWNDLVARKVCRKSERQLSRIPIDARPPDARALQARAESLSEQHAEELEKLLAAALEKPRRKRIHALRLKLKAIRYQEECLLGRRANRSHFLKRLKEVLRRLGKYEELAQFRKLAKRLGLDSRPAIVKDWRHATKRTRALLTDLDWIPAHLHTHKSHVPARRHAAQLAS